MVARADVSEFRDVRTAATIIFFLIGCITASFWCVLNYLMIVLVTVYCLKFYYLNCNLVNGVDGLEIYRYIHVWPCRTLAFSN